MDNAVLSLLTLGLPATQTDKRVQADSNASINFAVGQRDVADTAVLFQNALASAGLSLQPIAQQQINITNRTTEETHHRLEADFFKKLANDAGKDVISSS